MVRKIIFIILIIFLAACSSLLPGQELKLAEEAAIEFFQLLSQGQYVEADLLYGSDYTALISMNPDIPPDDHTAMWKNGCELNGLQCLPILRVVKSEKFSLNEFFLTIEFKNADGSVFVLGPCCGASEQEMPPVSQFPVDIIERDGRYYITSLPVFVP